MTYHKKGLKPQSPGVFHWVLKQKETKEMKEKKGGGEQSRREPQSFLFGFVLSCGLDS